MLVKRVVISWRLAVAVGTAITLNASLGMSLAASVEDASQQGTPQPPATLPADQSPSQPLFRAKVNLVRVDVSVHERNGEPLINLQPADFLVKEDGVPQTVETVQFVKLNGAPPADLRESIVIRSPEHAAAEAARDDVRLFVLFLDDYHVDKSPQVMIPLKRTLRAFVDRLGPFDLAAVVDPLTPLTHIEFTRDRNKLLETVNKFEGRRGELFPVRSAAEEAQQTQRNIWELRAGVTLDAVNAIATRLGGLREGRKSILFVSQGPPVSLRSSNWPRMEDVVQSANRGNVTIHTLDPRPLGSSEFGGNLVLRRFSDETGGRAIFNTNDHSEHLDEVIADASAYYLVGYTPSRGEIADGKFHKIDVDVKRPRVRVVARRGYWSPKAAELNAPRVEPVKAEVMTALTNLVEPKSGTTADVWIGYSRGAETTTDVTVSWDPSTRPGAPAASKVDVEQVGDDGSVTGTTQTVARRDAATAQAVARFSLFPGKSALRFTSYDEKGDVLDRWSQDLAVPTLFGVPLALATPRFLVARSAFELRALQAAPQATPAASRRLRKSDRLLIELEAYAAAGQPALEIELLNQKGDRLVTIPVKGTETGRARVEIPLQSLAAAVYVLHVTARNGEGQVEQHVPFRVVP